LESGHVSKPSNGWYAKVDKSTGEIGEKHRLIDTQNAEFWNDILANSDFKEYVRKKYEIAFGNIMGTDAELAMVEENEV
jgi:hypothetical protein